MRFSRKACQLVAIYMSMNDLFKCKLVLRLFSLNFLFIQWTRIYQTLESSIYDSKVLNILVQYPDVQTHFAHVQLFFFFFFLHKNQFSVKCTRIMIPHVCVMNDALCLTNLHPKLVLQTMKQNFKHVKNKGNY